MFDLYHFNSFGLPSLAKHYERLDRLEALPSMTAELKQWANDMGEQARAHILGGGSNLILAPELQRPVWHNQLKGVMRLEDGSETVRFRVGAGELWHDWVVYTLEQGFFGLENLALIPGTVGAAPVQNIGAYGVEVASFIESLTVWDIDSACFKDLTAQDCQFAYRHSLFKTCSHYLIVSVVFALPRDWKANLSYPALRQQLEEHPNAHDVFEAVCAIRRSKLPDPKHLGNVGSFFKNCTVSVEHYQGLKKQFPDLPCFILDNGYVRIPTAWLIEQAGYKGIQRGGVGVHHQQSLVLVNLSRASFDEVSDLATEIQTSVQKRFGLNIEIEPDFWRK